MVGFGGVGIGGAGRGGVNCARHVRDTYKTKPKHLYGPFPSLLQRPTETNLDHVQCLWVGRKESKDSRSFPTALVSWPHLACSMHR